MSPDIGEELRQALREAFHLADIHVASSSYGLFLDLAVPSIRKIIQREVIQQSIHPRVHHSEQSPPDRRLSDAESEILYLLCNGYSVARMAAHLTVPVETIRSRRVTLFRKLGTNNIASAIVIALREGLVRLEELSPEEHT